MPAGARLPLRTCRGILHLLSFARGINPLIWLEFPATANYFFVNRECREPAHQLRFAAKPPAAIHEVTNALDA